MYLPSRFAAPSDAEIEEVVRAHPFATLITGGDVSHVPLVLEKRGADWALIGHLARANPHWRALEAADSLAIFHGPNAYVTPLWYAEHDVPTWNYVVAHLGGRARLLEREDDTLRALRVLAAFADPAWEFGLPEDLARPGVLLKSIVGFELLVRTKQGKFKLGQNRSAVDIEGVREGLASRSDDGSRGVRVWMERLGSP